MDECGKPLQRGDFEQIREYLSQIIVSDRLKFKDLVSFLSDKSITSVVVYNRKNNLPASRS